MLENREARRYRRPVTPLERVFSRSPYAIVVVVARIKGNVSKEMLRGAVSKVQLRHPNLRVRITEDDDHDPWFTSEGAKEIPIEVVPRESDDHWIQVVQDGCQVPFEFDVRPAIRVILVHSPDESELLILCHHVICDGLSLSFLARDLMQHLGDPTRAVEPLPDPIPIDRDNMPVGVTLNPIARFFISRINRKWEEDKVFFDQDDYIDLSKTYWSHFRHGMLPVELSEAQTSALVHRCREEEVTVNSALATAFVGAQVLVLGNDASRSSIGVAGSLRDRLRRPAGEAMGFYAGAATMHYRYRSGMEFWENARRFHRKVRPLYTNKHLFKDLLGWCYLEPAILESINFKRLGGLVPPDLPRHHKLSAFSRRDDVVSSVLKRGKMDSLDRVVMGTAVTNLTRMDFPREYGTLELDRLIMKPGGAFPLVNVNLVLGAVTCAGKLSLVVEYAEESTESGAMERTKGQAMAFLLGE